MKTYCINAQDEKHKGKKTDIINLSKAKIEKRDGFIGNCKLCDTKLSLLVMAHPNNLYPKNIEVKHKENKSLIFVCVGENTKSG